MTFDEFLATDPWHLAVMQLNELIDFEDPACWYHSHFVFFEAQIDSEIARLLPNFLNGD